MCPDERLNLQLWRIRTIANWATWQGLHILYQIGDKKNITLQSIADEFVCWWFFFFTFHCTLASTGEFLKTSTCAPSLEALIWFEVGTLCLYALEVPQMILKGSQDSGLFLSHSGPIGLLGTSHPTSSIPVYWTGHICALSLGPCPLATSSAHSYQLTLLGEVALVVSV